MAKKVFLSPSDQWGNVYKTSNTREQVQCEIIANYAKIALMRSGVEVKVSVNDKNWVYEHVTVSNNWKPDLHLPIHTNALNGKLGGTQVYYGSIGKEKAQIMYNAVRAAFPDSLPHTRDKIDGTYGQSQGWKEFTQVNAYTLYVEAQFHDVAEISDYIVANVEKIGEAIAKGACEVLGVTYVAPEIKTAAATDTNNDAEKMYRVQVGAFKIKTNADNYVQKLKDAGFSAYIV